MCVELTIIVISRQVIVFFVYIVTVVILKLLKDTFDGNPRKFLCNWHGVGLLLL